MQLSTEIPLHLPVSRTLLKQSHNYVFHSNPHLNLHAWCLGVDSSKNKASLWRCQREFLLLRGHQQGTSTSQSGPYLRNGAEKIRWISQLKSVKQVSETGAIRPLMVIGQLLFTPRAQAGLHISQSSDVNRLLSSFHRDRAKSS